MSGHRGLSTDAPDEILLCPYIALMLLSMDWTVEFDESFEAEFDALPEPVQDALLVRMRLLEAVGPSLGRPHADTLEGSKHANMKELRCAAHGGAWRVAFAFDPRRSAILLVSGNKSGISQRRFYTKLIAVADARFDRHLAMLERR